MLKRQVSSTFWADRACMYSYFNGHFQRNIWLNILQFSFMSSLSLSFSFSLPQVNVISNVISVLSLLFFEFTHTFLLLLFRSPFWKWIYIYIFELLSIHTCSWSSLCNHFWWYWRSAWFCLDWNCSSTIK